MKTSTQPSIISPTRIGEAVAEISATHLQFSTQRLPGWVWLLTFAWACWGTTTVNPMITVAAIALLPILAQLLWRYGEPPVLVFACGMQWMQASAAIFYTDFYDMSLEQAFGGSEFETATWLSLIAVLAFAIGMRLALVRCKKSEHDSILTEGRRINVGKAFMAYLASFALAAVAGAIAFRVPRLTQIIFAFITIKWIAVFLVAYAVVEQRVRFGLLATVTALEFSVGLLGYFAGFKSVFFLLLVIILSSPTALRGRRLLVVTSIAAFLFGAGVVWTAIKSEYREFLNQGRDEQVVLVSADEQAEKLQELISNLSWQQVEEGLENMVLRVSYVKFFALTLINVPDAVPFENGALWLGAIKHVLMPRLLFPDKGEISDSDRTSYYVGMDVSGTEQGTSIGIGYIGESYIDFGPVYMFVPILLFGVFCGLIYRVFAIRAQCKILGVAIATSILIFGAYTIETSNIKLVGMNLMAVLLMGTLYVMFGRPFNAWLIAGTQNSSATGRMRIGPTCGSDVPLSRDS